MALQELEPSLRRNSHSDECIDFSPQQFPIATSAIENADRYSCFNNMTWVLYGSNVLKKFLIFVLPLKAECPPS